MMHLEILTMLSEQHRNELLAEGERQRIVRNLLKQQRQGGMILPSSMRANWQKFRRLRKKAWNKERNEVWILSPYYPECDREFFGKN